MGIALFRVDERLIHGQVVIGWGSQIRPARYVIVDDAVAGSDWEQELYTLGLPDGVRAEFLTVEEGLARLPALREDPGKSIVLTRDLGTVVAMAAAGALEGQRVNLGGIHHGPGRRQVLPYLYLDDQDRARLAELSEHDVTVTARDLPGSREVDLAHLLA